jgi:hypothetical protein
MSPRDFEPTSLMVEQRLRLVSSYETLMVEQRLRLVPPYEYGYRSPSRRRRGQSLVEFALVALVTYLLLAAIFTFGHALFAAQQAQSIVDFAAREISRTPLPADMTLEDVLYGNAWAEDADEYLQQFRREVFDQHYLVIELSPGVNPIEDIVPHLPRVNQMLYPLMVVDEIEGKRVLRYPGAVYSDPNSEDNPDNDPEPPTGRPGASGYLVTIPIMAPKGPIGPGEGPRTSEIVRFAPVLEEAKAEEADGVFQLEFGGLAALRINYPFQAAAMSAFEPTPFGGEPNLVPKPADDVTATGEPPGNLVEQDYTRVGPDGNVIYAGTHGGPYGLGSQGAWGFPNGVRPYRKVLSFQAVYRREIFR